MGVTQNQSPKEFGNRVVLSGANRFINNPLGLGGRRGSNFLADPLGLFGGGKKRVTGAGMDANGNYLVGGKPYDPNAIYNNPKNAEAARQIAIKLGTGAVNSIFDSPERAAQHTAFLTALRDYYTQDANKQKMIADRRLKFSMARNGLVGGSAQNDANVTLGEEYTKGLLGAENKAQGQYADLQQQDEQSRLNLLNMVRQGMDTTTAAQRAGAALQANAGTAQAAGMAQGLGDIFGSTAETYKSQADAAARRRGTLDAYGSVYGAKNPYAG